MCPKANSLRSAIPETDSRDQEGRLWSCCYSLLFTHISDRPHLTTCPGPCRASSSPQPGPRPAAEAGCSMSPVLATLSSTDAKRKQQSHLA